MLIGICSADTLIIGYKSNLLIMFFQMNFSILLSHSSPPWIFPRLSNVSQKQALHIKFEHREIVFGDKALSLHFSLFWYTTQTVSTWQSNCTTSLYFPSPLFPLIYRFQMSPRTCIMKNFLFYVCHTNWPYNDCLWL